MTGDDFCQTSVLMCFPWKQNDSWTFIHIFAPSCSHLLGDSNLTSLRRQNDQINESFCERKVWLGNSRPNHHRRSTRCNVPYFILCHVQDKNYCGSFWYDEVGTLLLPFHLWLMCKKNLCWTKVKATSVTRVLMLQYVTIWMYEYVCEK